MPTDTAPFDVTATTAPVITTIAAVDPAIVQVPQGHFLLVDALTVRNARTDASHDPAAWKYHHVGNYLLNDVLPPNHGQI
jgi:hypothetical protein